MPMPRSKSLFHCPKVHNCNSPERLPPSVVRYVRLYGLHLNEALHSLHSRSVATDLSAGGGI